MSTSHSFLKLMRKLHLYIGVFIAPALLFFAFTGALQTFSLHETTQGSTYKPPSWAVKLGQLHKKQTLELPVRKPHPVTDAPKGDKPVDTVPAKTDVQAPKPKTHLPMKIFFLLVAIGLLTSTVTGLYMAFRYSRNWIVITGFLLAGIIVPLLLLGF
jgi:uncharacterized iron-regulated membrane protein